MYISGDDTHTCIGPPGTQVINKRTWCNLHRWECEGPDGVIGDSCSTYIYEHARCGSRGRDPITHGDQCLTWCPEGSVDRDYNNNIIFDNGKWRCHGWEGITYCGS